MELDRYVEEIRQHYMAAADAGGESARALAERLVAPLDATVRLALQHALADAADEITVELAPGSVELRVRGRDLAFVVTPQPVTADGDQADATPLDEPAPDESDDDGGMARINVRMPERLKARVEHAAHAQDVSVNTWLVRAASAALGRAEAPTRSESTSARGATRYRGWAR
jgi:hypothetical protein